MITRRILDVFEKTGVMTKGHFVFASGRHGDRFMEPAQLFRFPQCAEEILTILADKFRDEKIDVVIGPALGAVQMSFEMARLLGCQSMFTERVAGSMTLRRGFRIKKGQRVLVVEDMITTGRSVNEVIELVHKAGGIVVGVGTVIDLSDGKSDLGVHMESVAAMELTSFDPEECPMCREGLKLTVVETKGRRK